MATLVKTGSVGYPWPLGKICPGADFATLSLPITQNVQPVKNDGVTPDNFFNGAFIQAHLDNESTIYVCSDANPPDTTNFTNVLAELAPGQWYPRNKEWANNRDISKLFVGAANASDFGIASIDAF